ncbi:hypothetical protein INR49_000374, partial [Caranx melampygus]
MSHSFTHLRQQEIPIFKPDQHLVQVLRSTPYRRLQYVGVEGMVQAEGEPLASKFVPRCFGVIQKIATEEHWKYWNSLTKTWNSRTMNRKETSNSVAFSLVSPGAYITDICVKVIGGEKPVAMEESEEMLRVGSTLTGFGEVVLEGGQVMRLQAPQDGRKFILVPSDYRSFMDRHESSAS